MSTKIVIRDYPDLLVIHKRKERKKTCKKGSQRMGKGSNRTYPTSVGEKVSPDGAPEKGRDDALGFSISAMAHTSTRIIS